MPHICIIKPTNRMCRDDHELYGECEQSYSDQGNNSGISAYLLVVGRFLKNDPLPNAGDEEENED